MFKKTLTATLMLGASTVATAEDFDPAQHLAEHCTRCHTDSVYTRPNRRATSPAKLARITRRCEKNLATGLFDDEVDLLVKYLNDTYYKF
jgi:hypothetical protein